MKTVHGCFIADKLVAGCATLLFLLSIVLLPARTASAAAFTCGSWSIVSSANASSNYNILSGVAAVSASNVWAVGYYSNPNSGVAQTLTEQWNGTGWSVVASPNVGANNNYLSSVAAVSASNVWAVGLEQTSSNTSRTLIEHWNGTVWKVISSPRVGLSANLTGVTAISASNAWVVGSYTKSSNNNQALIEHWNGTSWKVVTSPNAGPDSSVLSSVAAVSAKNVWAVGTYIPSSGPEQTLTEQWNGKSWSVVSSANVGATINYLNGVTAVPGSSDVWTVGGYYTGNYYEPLIEQWNGTSWSIVSNPIAGSDDNYLFAVSAISANDVWAVGNYYDPASGNELTLIEQWNGTSWNIVSSPNVASATNVLFSVATIPGSSNLWSVGNYQPSSGPVQTLTAFYC